MANKVAEKHYIADEKLGGIEREYVEVNRKASVGDYVHIEEVGGDKIDAIRQVVGFDRDYDLVLSEDIPSVDDLSKILIEEDDDFTTLSPTENVLIIGDIYRMVDREASIGEQVIILDGKHLGEYGEVVHDFEYAVSVNVGDDLDYYPYVFSDQYRVLDPVVPESKSAGSLHVDVTVDTEVISHLTDLIGNLAKTVAEQQRELDAVKRQLRGNTSILSDRIDANTEDIRTFAETASEAKHDSHNNRLDIEVIYKYIDSIMDDIVSLDERTQAEELARAVSETISKELAKGARRHGGR